MKLHHFETVNRDHRSETINAILATATKGASKDEIKRSAKLNFIQFNRYINYLLKQDLLAPRTQTDEAYLTTLTGINYLKTQTQQNAR